MNDNNSDDLIGKDVQNVFRLDGTPVGSAAAAQVPRPDKPQRRKASRTQRRADNERQLPVTCTGAGNHSDLQGLEGILTIDYNRRDEPFEATFDPADESIDNAVIPVYVMREKDGKLAIRSENTTWRFSVIEPEL